MPCLEKLTGDATFCGGVVEEKWQADHVLSHNEGGRHSAENYLAAHKLCNNYRWDYSSEEFQWILKIGIWARRQMETSSSLGLEMVRRFFGTRSKGSAAVDTFKPH